MGSSDLLLYQSAAGVVLRHFASGCQGPGQNGKGLTSPGVSPMANTITSHYNETPYWIYAVAPCYSGWISANPHFLNCTDPYTIDVGIVDPSGAVNQVKWGGNNTFTVQPGTNNQADLCWLTTPIPPYGHFFARTNAVAGGTGTLPISDIVTVTNGEAGEVAASGLANKSQSGVISGTTATVRPSGMLAMLPATQRSCAGIGDSLMCGTPGDDISSVSNYDARGNVGCYGRAFSGLLPFINIATGGTAVSNNCTASILAGPLGLLKMAGITDVFTNWGVNDLNIGFSVAAIESSYQQLWGLLSTNGQEVHQTTVTPATLSSFDYINASVQTPRTGGGSFTGGPASKRAQLCNFTRAKPAPLRGVIEVAYPVETSPDSGIWGSGAAFNSNLSPIDTWTVQGSPTTTSIPSNSTRPTGYYTGAVWIEFTSGLNSGTIKFSNSYSPINGTFTVGALANAPAVGDTFKVYPFGCQCTDDGFHPWRIDTAGDGIKGGHMIILPIVQSYLQALNPATTGPTPANVPTCKLFLQSYDQTTIQEAKTAAMEGWLDKSGSGNNAFNNTQGTQVITGASVINNRNALKYFTGSGFFLPSGLYNIGAGDNTVFIVLAADPTGDATKNVLAGFNAGGSMCWGVQLTASNLNVANSATPGAFTSMPHTLDSSVICVGFRRSGTSIQPFINGVNGTAGSNATNFTATLMNSGGNTVLSANRYKGSGGAFCVYNSSLPNAQMNQVGLSLAAEFGFTWTNM